MIGKKIALVIIVVASVGGCLTLKELLVEPEIQFESVSVKDVSLFQSTPVFKFKVTNPNPIEIPVRNVTYSLKINNRKFIKGASEKGLSLKSGGTGMLELPFTIQYIDLFESLKDFIKTDRVNYDLEGTADVGGLFTVPYQKSGTIEIPRLPEVSLKKVDIGKMSLKGAALTFTMDIVNPNDFPIRLNELNYGIRMDGKEIASMNNQSIPDIGKKEKTVLRVPLHLNFIELGQSVYNLFTKPSVEYDLSGIMKFDVPGIGLKDFPFGKSGQVKLK